MDLEITAPPVLASNTEFRLRATLFNDSYEPVVISRNGFVGPNLRILDPPSMPLPDSVEPTFGGPDEPLTLQPFTYYGRERVFPGLGPCEVEVSAIYRAEGGDEIVASAQIRIEEDRS